MDKETSVLLPVDCHPEFKQTPKRFDNELGAKIKFLLPVALMMFLIFRAMELKQQINQENSLLGNNQLGV